jgi:translation initiation factor 2 beta subunit (eIF-2beta)/eIF-5
MYSTLYIEFFQKIQDCKNPPSNVARDGKQMLLACPATIKLYNQLISEHADRNQLKPIGK